MIKKYKDYIILLIVLLIIIFGPSLGKFLVYLNRDLNVDNINNSYCNSLEDEYNELLIANDFKLSSELNLELSKVLLRDIYEFRDTLTIYKGYDDDIDTGMAVITDKGLVGVIKNTSKSTSIVELITSKNSNISVRINEYYGILKVIDNSLVVSDLQAYDDIKVGDKIYTSGIGNLPGDIYVGVVSEVNLNNTEIEKIVTVTPGVDIDNINYVMVVL